MVSKQSPLQSTSIHHIPRKSPQWNWSRNSISLVNLFIQSMCDSSAANAQCDLQSDIKTPFLYSRQGIRFSRRNSFQTRVELNSFAYKRTCFYFITAFIMKKLPSPNSDIGGILQGIQIFKYPKNTAVAVQKFKVIELKLRTKRNERSILKMLFHM